MAFYEDKRRSRLLTGAAIAAGAGTLLYSSRREFVELVSRKIASRSEAIIARSKLGRISEYKIAEEVSSFHRFKKNELETVAYQTAGRKRLEQFLAREVPGTSIARELGIDKEFAESIIGSGTRVKTLLDKRITNPSDIWANPAFNDARELIRSAVKARNPQNLQSEVSRFENELLGEGGLLSRARYAADISGSRAVLQTQGQMVEQSEDLYYRQLKERSEKFKNSKFGQRFGVQQASLGQLVEQIKEVDDKEVYANFNKQMERLTEIIQRGIKRSGDKVSVQEIMGNLPVEDVLAINKGGETELIDFRGARQLEQQILHGARNEFQIPIGPFMFGINPFKLFPWLSGKTMAQFSHISSWGKPLTAASSVERALNLPARLNPFENMTELGINILHVGDLGFAAQIQEAGENYTVNIGEMAGRWSTRNVRTGFNAAIAQSLVHYGSDNELIEAALQSPNLSNKILGHLGFALNPEIEGTGNQILDLFGLGKRDNFYLAKQHHISKIEETRSIFTKFSDPSWIRNVAKRVFDPQEEANPSDLHKIIEFLETHGSIDPHRFHEKIVTEDMINVLQYASDPKEQNKLLAGVLSNFEDDQTIINFFSKAGESIQRFESNQLGSLVNQFKTNPSEVLERSISPFNKRVMSLNIFGEPDVIRGVDIMRHAIMEEVGFRFGPNQAFRTQDGLIKVEGISQRIAQQLEGKEKGYATAWYTGTLLNKWTQDINFIPRAFESIRSNQGKGIQATTEWLLDKHTSFLETHVKPNDINLGTNIMMVQKGKSTFSFLRELVGNVSYNPENPLDIISDALSNINATLKERGAQNPKNILGIDIPAQITGIINDPWTQQYKGFFTGMRNTDIITDNTLASYFFTSRLNEMAAVYGLGLPGRDLGSGFDIYKGLLLKRVIPVMAGIEYWKYLNFELGQQGLPRPDHEIAKIKSNIAIHRARYGMHHHELEIYAGLDNYMSGRDEEEEKEHQLHGYDPIRKGRWWALGSRSPLYGEKIDYWRPSSYQIAMSDYQEADNVDLNSDFYWQNSLLPTPRHPLCVLPESIVVSKSYVKNIENIKPGDLVTNHHGEETCVIATLNRLADEKANEIYASGRKNHPIRVTENHQILIIKPENIYKNVKHRSDLKDNVKRIKYWMKSIKEEELLNNSEWVKAKDVKEGDFVISSRYSFGDLKQIDISKFSTWTAVTDNWCYIYLSKDTAEMVENIENGNTLNKTEDKRYDRRLREKAKRRIKNNSLERVPRYLEISEDLAFVIGWYIAEGHVTNRKGYGSVLHFTLNIKEIDIANKLISIIRNITGFRETKNNKQITGNSIRVNIFCSWFAKLIGTIGGNGASNKQLPEWIYDSSKEISEVILDAYLEGDGWKKGRSGSRLCATVSKVLATQLSQLGDALGYATSTVVATKAGEKFVVGKLCKTKNSWRVSFPKQNKKSAIIKEHFVFREVLECKSFHYTGIVYDLEVKDGESFTLAGGIVHNSFLTRLTQPYNWEYKHSISHGEKLPDRPFLLSGPMSDPATPWGGFINATIGKVLKPVKVLYPEYFNGKAHEKEIAESNRRLKEAGHLEYENGASTYINVPYDTYEQDYDDFLQAQGSIARVGAGGSVSLQTAPGDLSNVLGTDDRSKGRQLSRRQLEEINRALKQKGSGLVDAHASEKQEDRYSQEVILAGKRNMGKIQRYELVANRMEEMGLYGWMGELLIPGLQEPRGYPIIQSPQRAYGAERRFWDLDLGGALGGPGLGGDLSELVRRFIPHRPRQINELNPVPNDQSDWLPGDNYFATSPRRGDPYVSAKLGEIRLPGEAYERVHNIRLFKMRASSLGKSENELEEYFKGRRETMSDYGDYVTELGTAWHKKIQARWAEEGFLEGSEVEVYNKELDISGHIDAILKTNKGKVVADIKTMSEKKFLAADRPYQEHLDQVNFYLHETGIPTGLLVYVDREHPGKIREFAFGYSQKRFDDTINRVQTARENVWKQVESGEVKRGDLYDSVSRFQILGDIASYSEEYKALRTSLASDDQLTEDEKKEVIEVKKRVALQHQRIKTYDYHFKGLYERVERKNFTVEEIIDANTIKVKESDSPLRLAGVRLSESRLQDLVRARELDINLKESTTPRNTHPYTEAVLSEFGVKPGAHISAYIEKDNPISDDVMGTTHAVLFSGGRNVNLELLKENYATEKRSWTDKPDWSPLGTMARFTPSEIEKGARWERISHLDTFINSKFMKVRSPLEEYERGHVYGTTGSSWNSPIKSYITPTITSYMMDNPIIAAAEGAVFASLFASRQTGKKNAAIIGAAFMSAASILRSVYEDFSGQSFIPPRTQKKREIEEYFDILKYVKYSALESAAREKALSEEGFDVETMEQHHASIGKWKKRQIRELEREKRQLKRLPREERENAQELVASLTDRIQYLQEPQGAYELGPWATTALLYRQLKERTMYGAEPGKDFEGLLASLPKAERELAPRIIDQGSTQEKKRFYELLPDFEKRLLGEKLGIDDVPEKEPLEKYFRRHTLPGENWEGWKENNNLEDFKQNATRLEGLDPIEMGYYPQTVEKARLDTQGIPTPTVNGSSANIASTLHNLLSGHGIKDLRIKVRVIDADSPETEVNMNLNQDRHQEIIDAIQNLY